MKNTKSLLISILVICFVAIGAYLLYQSNSEKDDNIVKIGFLVPNLENPFFVDMTNAAKAKESDSLKIFVQASPDELKQNQIIENFITQGVNAICVVPINSKSIIPAIIKANKAGIPIINVDNKVDMESADAQGAEIAFYIGSDNFEGGQLAGNYITDQLGESGKVAILEGVSGNDAAIKRKGGFLDAVKDNQSITVVASQAADWSREKANEIFQAILTANPDLDAVFASNDEMALGAIAAMKNMDIPLDSIIVVGFDAIDEAVKAVENEELDATIAQQPKLMGERAIELTLAFLADRQVDQEYSTPLKLIK